MDEASDEVSKKCGWWTRPRNGALAGFVCGAAGTLIIQSLALGLNPGFSLLGLAFWILWAVAFTPASALAAVLGVRWQFQAYKDASASLVITATLINSWLLAIAWAALARLLTLRKERRAPTNES